MKKKKWCGVLIAALLIVSCGADGGENRKPDDAQTAGQNGTETGGQENNGAEADGQGSDVSDGTETDGQGDAADQTGAADLDGMQAPPTDYVSEELYLSADQWASCDDAALAAVMRKAEAGEPVTIACIGGSITQGTISNGTDDSQVSPKKSYADIYFSWWEQTFPDTEFTFINAGIGATDSYIGVHRVQKDVLDFFAGSCACGVFRK